MAITKLAQYESNMTYWGNILRQALLPGSGLNADQKQLNCYYDAQRVFYRIATYTGDTTTWNAAATLAQDAYYSYYVNPNNGSVPAFWSFTDGGREDYLRTGDTVAQNSVNLLSNNAAYHRDIPDTLVELSGNLLSRENAYAGIAHMNAELVGASRRARLATLLENALSHINQWCTALTAPYFRPFMGALTAKFLIQYYSQISPDPRIPTAIATMYDYAHSTCWNSSVSSWNYTDRNVGNTDPPDLSPSYDLNLLILPALGWLWWQTGDQKWKDRGDAAFDAGVAIYDAFNFWVSGAYLGGASPASILGKHFNQNYVWSPDYLTWRALTPVVQEQLSVTGTINGFNSFSRDVGGAAVNGTDTLKCMLLSSSWTPSQSGYSILSNLTGEVSGNGYARQTLSGVTWTRSGAVSTLTCNPITFSATGGDIPARYWAIYNDTVASPVKPLLLYGLIDNNDRDVTIRAGSTLVITPGASGLMTITRT